jgi:hypothetical protein
MLILSPEASRLESANRDSARNDEVEENECWEGEMNELDAGPELSWY